MVPLPRWFPSLSGSPQGRKCVHGRTARPDRAGSARLAGPLRAGSAWSDLRAEAEAGTGDRGSLGAASPACGVPGLQAAAAGAAGSRGLLSAEPGVVAGCAPRVRPPGQRSFGLGPPAGAPGSRPRPGC